MQDAGAHAGAGGSPRQGGPIGVGLTRLVVCFFKFGFDLGRSISSFISFTRSCPKSNSVLDLVSTGTSVCAGYQRFFALIDFEARILAPPGPLPPTILDNLRLANGPSSPDIGLVAGLFESRGISTPTPDDYPCRWMI